MNTTHTSSLSSLFKPGSTETSAKTPSTQTSEASDKGRFKDDLKSAEQAEKNSKPHEVADKPTDKSIDKSDNKKELSRSENNKVGDKETEVTGNHAQETLDDSVNELVGALTTLRDSLQNTDPVATTNNETIILPLQPDELAQLADPATLGLPLAPVAPTIDSRLALNSQQGLSLSQSVNLNTAINQANTLNASESLLAPKLFAELPTFSSTLFTQQLKASQAGEHLSALSSDSSALETADTTNALLSPRIKTLGADTPATLPLNASFQSGKWGEAVTERVMWMSSKGIKEASIQLDPPELGQLSIKISVNQDQTHVSFTVQNANVREALDQSALRLREMLAEEGLHLADVDVSDQSQSNTGDDESEGQLVAERGAHSSDEESDAQVNVQDINVNYNLIDSYA